MLRDFFFIKKYLTNSKKQRLKIIDNEFQKHKSSKEKDFYEQIDFMKDADFSIFNGYSSKENAIRHRVSERMLNTFLITKPKSSYSAIYYSILKDLTIAKGLFGIGLKKSAIKRAEKSLKLAQKTSNIDLIIICIRFLRKSYFIQKDWNKLIKSDKVLNLNLSKYVKLLHLEDAYFKKSYLLENKFLKKVNSKFEKENIIFSENIRSVELCNDSKSYHLQSLILDCLMKENYEESIHLCDKLITLIENLNIDPSINSIWESSLQKIHALIALKEYKISFELIQQIPYEKISDFKYRKTAYSLAIIVEAYSLLPFEMEGFKFPDKINIDLLTIQACYHFKKGNFDTCMSYMNLAVDPVPQNELYIKSILLSIYFIKGERWAGEDLKKAIYKFRSRNIKKNFRVEIFLKALKFDLDMQLEEKKERLLEAKRILNNSTLNYPIFEIIPFENLIEIIVSKIT